MATLASILCLVFGISVVFAREPVVSCPVPLSPENGQSFLFRDGQVVKIVCEAGYLLLGKEIVRCIGGQWEEPFPTCVDVSGDEEEEGDVLTTPPISTAERPLFNWGGNEDEVPVLGDEAKLRRVLYPRRMLLPARVGRRPSSDLDEEEKKRSAGKTVASKWTTMTLEPPAPLVYVRRTVSPGKKATQQERTLNEQYRTASIHMTVDSTDRGKENVAQQATLPRAAVSQQPQNDKGDDTLRHNYWLAQHYYYNRQPSSSSPSPVMEYRTADPRVVTLTESQMAWINSLHPELRDQYLRDLYVMRAEEATEGVRSQAFLRRYGDAWYRYPYYLREPVATDDLTAIYDYSCNQAGHPFVTAPRLANAHITRYDRRQNPNPPNQHYLAAIYKCNPGYVLYDSRNTELVCSRRNWIGTQPMCVPRG